MSENEKSKLNAKMGAVAGDEELDQVASGTYQENMEILDALKRIDSKGVNELLSSLSPDPNIAKTQIDKGTKFLLKWNFGIESKPSSTDSNLYFFDEDYRDHAEVLDKINQRAMEWGRL